MKDDFEKILFYYNNYYIMGVYIMGVQKKSAKILTMEAKTVKTNKSTKSGQKLLKSTKSCDYFEPL